MAIEIEKKFCLDLRQYEDLPKRLSKLGAVFEGDVFEENYLHRGGMLDSRRAVLRLRKTGDKATLTYKENIDGEAEIKQKIEFETEVTDVDATEEIIRMLGYRLSIVYEKRRRTWTFGNVEIVLDELPFGLYMEIEGSERSIISAEKRLGIKQLTPELRGYPRLTIKYGRMRKGVMEARFDRRRSKSVR